MPRRCGPQGCATAVSGYPRIIDGDTLEVAGTRVRLHGVDTPEPRQPCVREGIPYDCGRIASAALKRKIGGREVSCRSADGTRDRRGRLVAVCGVVGEDGSLNAWLISQGLAVAYRRFSNDYDALEEEGKAAGIGIWATEFMPPEDWRRLRRQGQR
ncbi:hypothetical protein TSO5_15855 [Azospirillum sp. TSO5]|nr:hypothetical protein TSO5_15855 [Azospirillum sp. TSO5]